MEEYLRLYSMLLILIIFLRKLLKHLLFLIFFSPTVVFAEILTLYADHWEPYNYQKDGRVIGISTDLIRKAFVRAEVPHKIYIMPWKRAYLNTQAKPNTAFFTVNRTEERESQFKWVGPIFEQKVYVFSLKSRRDIEVNRLDDINNYRTGVLFGGSVYAFLKNAGISDERLDIHTHARLHLVKLFAQRIDLAPGDEIDFAYQVRGLGYRFSELEKKFFLYQGSYYLAFNLQTSDELVDQIQKAVDQLIMEGERARIVKQYLDDDHLGHKP